MRTITEFDLVAIKGATEAAYARGGGVTSFPSCSRNNVSTHVKYASVTRVVGPDGAWRLEYGDKVVPVDIAIEADRRAKHPFIIGEAARQLGYRLEPLHVAPSAGSAISERDAHVILGKAMCASNVLLGAYEDGRMDALEKKQFRAALRELIAEATRIHDSIDRE